MGRFSSDGRANTPAMVGKLCSSDRRSKVWTPRGGHNKEEIILTVHGFKQLCMAANTDKARHPWGCSGDAVGMRMVRSMRLAVLLC